MNHIKNKLTPHSPSGEPERGKKMNVEKIINKYYGEYAPLKRILLIHSKKVAERALRIIDEKALPLDRQFVYDAAMLHDLGIVCCNAAVIECFGTEHYLRHGLCGAKLLRDNAAEWGMPPESIEPYARVCERHTGAGLTKKDIVEQGLPLPAKDFLPETLEEKLICYADSFYSKTHLTEEKSYDRVLCSLQKFGKETVERFLELHRLFG